MQRFAARPSALARAGWFVWLPVWLSLGIGLWFALRVEPGAGSYAAAALAAGLGLAAWVALPAWGARAALPWRLLDGLRLGGLTLSVAAIGFLVSGWHSAQVAGPVLGWRYYGPVEGRLVEIDRSGRDKLRLTLDQVSLSDLPPWRVPRRVRLSLSDMAAEAIPPPGTRVMTTGHLGPPPGPAAPGSFDFRRQAWFEGLGASGYTRNPVMIAAAARDGPTLALARLRQRMSQAMQQAIGGQEGAVASALMTGDRSGIAEATNAVMRDANLYHIVSISGLHMSMLAGFIYGALRMALAAAMAATGRGLGWPAHKLAAAVALLAAAFYMALSDGGVATERAFVMVAVMLGAILVDRRAISLRTVALAALILLLLAPDALTQPGFQMSFAATVALILCAGPWARVSPRLPRLLRPVAMLVISSLVAGLATAPLAAAHFNRMSEYGLLANLLAVPVMGAVVMPAGVVAAVLAPIGLAQPALWVMGIGTGWMLAVARFVAGLHGSVSSVAAPPGAVLPLLGLGGAILALSGGTGAVMPRAMVRGTGAALLAAAAAVWMGADRPALLIAPEGDAVGLMTVEGRALSKPKGGSFTVSTWLVEDGDGAPQEEAAARTGWDGPPGARRAVLPDGRAVVHLTGKGSAAAVAGACTGGAVVIAATQVESPPKDCLLFDQLRLARTGAVAIDATGQLETVADRTGVRAWSPSPRARRDGGQGRGRTAATGPGSAANAGVAARAGPEGPAGAAGPSARQGGDAGKERGRRPASVRQPKVQGSASGGAGKGRRTTRPTVPDMAQSSAPSPAAAGPNGADDDPLPAEGPM